MEALSFLLVDLMLRMELGGFTPLRHPGYVLGPVATHFLILPPEGRHTQHLERGHSAEESEA